ncbi:GAF domain-containing sensor histidine kinase [Nocardioides sp. Bht2]|uniref:GAF domain-containing sensor histidine kinase n=1 Tax=Nocardioides sp. Bht2 TaxID=3392297 RepID=UPI0039B3AE98
MEGRSGPPADAAALLDAVVAIGSDLDLHSVLRRITETSCALTGARYGFLAILNDDGEVLDFVTHGMSDHVAMAIARLPEAVGLLGLITRSPRAVRLRDLSQHPTSAGFPSNHPQMTTFLGMQVRVRGKVFGNLYLTEKQGGEEFTESDEAFVEALAGAAGYVVDNARAYALSEVRRKWLLASNAVTERLQTTDDIGDVLDLVVRGAREASGGALAALVLPTGGGPPVVVATDCDEPGGLADRLAPLTADIDGLLPHDPMVVRRHQTHGTVVLTPMRVKLAERAVLVIWLASGRGSLEPGTDEMLAVYSDQASLAFDRAEAVADRETLVLTTDRERIARDLHDVVIQRIFATGLQLQGLRPRISDDEARERIDTAVADLDTTIRDIRSTIFELQHRSSASLRGDLIALIKEYTPILGFRAVLRTSGPVDTLVVDDYAHHLTSVLRELLSNVARHAAATACEVRVDADVEGVVLTVTDDGVGVPAERVESGLSNARIRAQKFGGSLSVEPNLPRGTRLRWHVRFQE